MATVIEKLIMMHHMLYTKPCCQPIWQSHVPLTHHRHLTWTVSGLPDSKVHGANMGPIWGQQDLGGPHVSHMNLVILGLLFNTHGQVSCVKLVLRQACLEWSVMEVTKISSIITFAICQNIWYVVDHSHVWLESAQVSCGESGQSWYDLIETTDDFAKPEIAFTEK